MLSFSDSAYSLELTYRGRSCTDHYVEESCDVSAIIEVAHTLADFVCNMHDAGVIHGDIKNSNVGVQNQTARCFDMGLSACVAQEKVYSMCSSMGGTLQYLAPEVAYLKSFCGYSDMWSVGVLLLSMMFTATHALALQQSIVSFLKITKDEKGVCPFKGEGTYNDIKSQQKNFLEMLKNCYNNQTQLCPKMKDQKVQLRELFDLITTNLLQIDYAERKTAKAWLDILNKKDLT